MAKNLQNSHVDNFEIWNRFLLGKEKKHNKVLKAIFIQL
jgi:hypothetical protein